MYELFDRHGGEGGGGTDVSERTHDGEIVWRRSYFRLNGMPEKTCPFRRNVVMFISWHRPFMRCSRFLMIISISMMVIALSLEPGHPQ